MFYKGIHVLCDIEGGAKIVNTHHTLQSYYPETSTYRCLRVCPSEVVRILCQHPPSCIWLSILSWPEAGQLGGQQNTSQYISLVVIVLNPTL